MCGRRVLWFFFFIVIEVGLSWQDYVEIRIMDFVDSVVTWVFRNYVLARFLSFLPDQLTEKRDKEFIYWMVMDKKKKKALQFDNGRHWQHVLINDRFSEKASKHHSTVSIHPYVCALVQRWKQHQELRCTPIVKRSYTSSVYESTVIVTNKQSNKRMNEWRPFFLYSVHTSYNKVLLCFTTRDHACHFLSAVKLDITRLPTLLIVFDMRAWCRLILEVSLLPSGPFWYSFWSSSRRLDTWKIKELVAWFP